MTMTAALYTGSSSFQVGSSHADLYIHRSTLSTAAVGPDNDCLDERAAFSSSLPDLKNRSENSAGRGQILTISPGNSRSIAQESGEI